MAGQPIRLGAAGAMPRKLLCAARPVAFSATVAPQFPTDARGRTPQSPSDLTHRRATGNTPGDLLALVQAQRAGIAHPRSRRKTSSPAQHRKNSDWTPTQSPPDLAQALPLLPAPPDLRPELLRHPPLTHALTLLLQMVLHGPVERTSCDFANVPKGRPPAARR